MDSTPLRIALYSHDAQGLGHIRRHHALAKALAQDLPGLIGRPVTGLLICGTAEAGRFERPPGWDLLVLPALAKHSSHTYEPRHLRIDRPSLGYLRSAVLSSALESFDPDLLVVDKHPAGVDGELLPALARLDQTTVVLGLREILDDPVTARSQWHSQDNTSVVERYYHRLWIYGDELLHDPFESGEIPRRLSRMADFTGYLSRGRQRSGDTGPISGVDRTTLLTVVGGGDDGAPLALAAASAPVPAGLKHVVCTGPNMPSGSIAAVRRAAGPDTTVVRSLDRVPDLLARAAGVVAMGGYNTVCEVLATDTPALVVPRREPRREQLIRAELMAGAGLVDHHTASTPRSDLIGAWFAGLRGRRVHREGINLDGLARIAPFAADLVTATTGSNHVAV